jgi:hypothetical protein
MHIVERVYCTAGRDEATGAPVLLRKCPWCRHTVLGGAAEPRPSPCSHLLFVVSERGATARVHHAAASIAALAAEAREPVGDRTAAEALIAAVARTRRLKVYYHDVPQRGAYPGESLDVRVVIGFGLDEASTPGA